MSSLFSAVPVGLLAAVLATVLSIFLILAVIGFIQGRRVSLWPPSIGPRRRTSRSIEHIDKGASQSDSQNTEPTSLLPERLTVADRRWTRNAMVDHDRLFGVDSLIESVEAAVASPSANWIVSLFGDGGIGKTAVAYEVAKRCAGGGSFSRIAWASATNISQTQLTGLSRTMHSINWLDLVRTIAGQVGVELGLTRTLWEHELAQGIAALESGEQLLTVIDNLESTGDAAGITDQLQMLGLARPHKVLLTTRWSVQEHYSAVAEYRVRSLGRSAALDLIHHLGRGDQELREASSEALDPLLAITEGNPFLIKLAIKHYLVTHRSLDLVMAELTSLHSENVTGSASLAQQIREHLYVRSLEELERRAGYEGSRRLMSSFCAKDKGDAFSYAELAAISGISNQEKFDDTLTCACRLALVRSSDMNRSYSIHSLLHEFTCRRT